MEPKNVVRTNSILSFAQSLIFVTEGRTLDQFLTCSYSDTPPTHTLTHIHSRPCTPTHLAHTRTHTHIHKTERLVYQLKGPELKSP